jgi:hypothetical protein
MPRPRTNDPLGVSDHPQLAVDPERITRIQQEFRRRLIHTLRSFSVARTIERDYGTIEASLVRLREALARRRPVKRQGLRLHPEVEMALSYKARQFADERTKAADAKVEQRDVQKAALWVTNALTVKQGAPTDRMLVHHVEALMALAQQTTGRPVLSRRDRNSVYDPHLADPKAQMIFEALNDIDPDVTVTKVVNIIRQARRKYAGKAMRFSDFMPAYGGEVEAFVPNFPIYCP